VQVLCNLLRGAFKQTSRGGRVYVHGIEKGGDVELKVSYAGVGFSAEQLNTIFDWNQEPAGNQAPGAKDGLRIGLAIAREILHAHNGDIGVESRGLEHGATFWLRIPVSKNGKETTDAI
jgi:K+-sensing histidine kinase KdpD